MPAPLTRVGSPALTREELVNVLTMPLVAANVVLSSGVRIYDAPTAVPLKIPKLTAISASGWYAEGQEIADSEAPTDYLTLLPPTLKSAKTWLPMSSEVIRNSPLALDAAMRDQLVFSVSRVLEVAFFKGDSTPDGDGNHTPEGILNWDSRANERQTVTITGTPTGGSFTLTYGGQTTGAIAYNATAAAVRAALEALQAIGVGNVTTGGGALPGTAVTVDFVGALGYRDVALMTATSALTGGTTPAVDVVETTKGVDGVQRTDKAGVVPTLDDFGRMIGMVEAAYATPKVWWMSPQMLTLVRLMKDEYGRFQLQPNPQVQAGMVLFGIPVKTTPHLNEVTGTQSSVVLADTDFIAVGRDNAPEARIFTETLAKRDEIALRVTCRYDIGPVWPAAIAIMDNAETVAP